jgi:hypothetical protein
MNRIISLIKAINKNGITTQELKTNSVKSLNEEIQITMTETGDDKGVFIEGGQLSVGSKDEPHESIFGAGDSYPVEIAFHYNTANESGGTITGAADITTILKSDQGSTTPMFANNLAGEVVMIGATIPPGGVKSKWDSLGNLEPDRIIGEYLNNVGVWEDNTYGVTNANSPYQRYSWSIASATNEQLRFGLSLISPNQDFESRTLNINGVDYNYYWVRVRLLTPVTEVPVLQQVKTHTNRTEINADGVVEFFGLARGVKNIEILETANQASDPANENVSYFTGGINGGISKLSDNEFADNAVDSRMYLAKIDSSIDTSTPIVISIPFYVKGTGTGDIDFTIEYVQITNDFVYDTLVSPDETFDVIYPIITPSDLERQLLRFEIPINEINPTVGGVMIAVSRDARASNPNDTLPNNIVLTGSTGDGRVWRL